MNCKELIHNVVAHLSGKSPNIDVVEDEHGAVITLTVHGDTSSVIGKRGQTIDALRTLVKAVGYNGKHRIKLCISEDETDRSTDRG